MSDLKTLIHERLRKATADGWDPRSICILLSALTLSGLSTSIFYQSNVNAGSTIADSKIAEALRLSPELFQGLLTSGSLTINGVINTYFSQTVPNDILSAIQSNPIVAQSTMAKINNDEELKTQQKAQDFLVDLTAMVLKLIPVTLSTAQFMALGLDSGLPTWLLVAQLITYSLMHWSAVVDFVENWVNVGWKNIRSFVLKMQQKTDDWQLVKENKKMLLDTYKEALDQALFTFRILVQKNDRATLDEIYVALGNTLENVDQSDPELAFALMIKLLSVSIEKKIDPGKRKVNLLPIDLINFILLNLCYLGYDLAVYHQSSKLCDYAVGEADFCDDETFKTSFTVIATFPLNYLISVIIATQNTQALWDYFTQKNQARSIGAQRFPVMVALLSVALLWCAAWSWGTAVLLNAQFIKNAGFLLVVNIIAIIYNTFFNAFPISSVTPSLAVFLMSCWIDVLASLKGGDSYRIHAQMA